MITKKDIEQMQLDANRYTMEMKRDALSAIVPSPEEKESRIDLIGLLAGRRPDMRRLFLASVEQEGWISLANAKVPDLKSMDAISFLRSHANSLDGKRSNQVVEIARTDSPVTARSILDVLKAGKR